MQIEQVSVNHNKVSHHAAVVIVAAGQPLEVHQVPTPNLEDNEIKVRVEWTASTPLDLHQADGGLLVKPPHIMGSSAAGIVVEVGSSVTLYKPGDKVFGYGWRKPSEKSHQLYSVAPQNLWGRIPENFTMRQAVTLPNNFVSVYHTLTHDLGFELPWPKPESYEPREAGATVLIWGGSSSCGMYAIQLLKYFGYKNIITTASQPHHSKLESYGAKRCFDYREEDVENAIIQYTSSQDKPLQFIFDCIGSLSNSMNPIRRLAKSGTRVAILLPVVVKDVGEGLNPEFTLDVNSCVPWATGVQAVGVRTHFYTDNAFLAQHLQSTIMPEVLAKGIIEPNDQVVVEGASLLERAKKALSMLRKKQVSGARLVWRVAETES